jgi:hypothetical protein
MSPVTSISKLVQCSSNLVLVYSIWKFSSRPLYNSYIVKNKETSLAQFGAFCFCSLGCYGTLVLTTLVYSVVLLDQILSMSDDLPSFLDITPFGPYCQTCNVTLPIQAGILIHGKEAHPKCLFKNAAVVRQVQRRMLVLRNTHADDLSPFLTDQRATVPTWFCTACFRSFSKNFSYTRHLDRNKECTGRLGGKLECYVTICGRLGPKKCTVLNTTTGSTFTTVSNESTLSTLTDSFFQSSINHTMVVETSSKVPTTLLFTQEQASEVLAPFVRPDENVRDLTLIYFPILTPGFEGKMKEFLSYSTSQSVEDGILLKWIETGREWLGNYAAAHIANVSANVRSRLAEFEQREVDGSSVGTRTFTLRRGIPRLMTELDALLRFFYRYPTTLFDSFKSTELLNATKFSMIESAIIPKILSTAAAEEPNDHGRLPVVCLYCLSRGFTIKGGIDLVMTECGGVASRISSVLHLLRAGVCGYLVTLSVSNASEMLSAQEMDIVNRVQNGRVTNLLAPYVKRLRDMYSRKPPAKSNTVNGNGDITSGSFTFPHSVWSTIIPRLVEISNACFSEIFVGGSWKLFMEKPISMTDWVLLEASVTHDDTSTWIRDIVVKEDKEPILAKVLSLLELCFLGLGVGAVRHEEVLRLKVLSCRWHNSYLYFWTESFKKGSMKASTTPKLIEHRLSLSLSRVVLLGRRALMSIPGIGASDNLFSDFPGVSMLGLVQEVFDFDCPPQMLNVRHLFTSVGNVIFPENSVGGNDGCLVSDLVLTEKSGHTQGTGRRSYGTWLENSDEAIFDLYHTHLGELTVDPPAIVHTPFSDSILKSALKQLLGRDALFRSEHQRFMIEIAANSISRHAFVGLPCGHGKSLSWMVPTLASYLAGRHIGLRIVVLPYKFLLGHVVHHATTMLGLLRKKVLVSYLDSSQISHESLPSILQEGALPNLLFLNLDGAATLLRYHLSYLQDLAGRNILKQFYLDEFQQLLVEYSFRSSYQSFQELGRIGVPVMCLSGSLPCTMAMSLMSYCRLIKNPLDQSVDIVRSTDPIGDGFSLDVQIVDDIATAVIDYVSKSRVGACHVLCSSIALVEAISKGLSSSLDVLSITGESSYQEQVACSKNWYTGGRDVLVSTVVALVGNENRQCKTIVIAGFLYNVSSLVQAIGRLRPEQRGHSSKVQIFRYPLRSVNRMDARLDSQHQFSEIVDAGCLDLDSKELFLDIFSSIGLQQFFLLKEGCYLQHLSKLYGFVRLPCGRCGLCTTPHSVTSTYPVKKHTVQLHANVAVFPDVCSSRSRNPIVSAYKAQPVVGSSETLCDVIENKGVAEEEGRIVKVMRRKAKWVFCELLYRCIACGKSICNGECVIGCYRCGSANHRYNVCTYDMTRLATILPNKGVCFGCFDTKQHLMTDHDIKNCPLKRRLKRLIFLDHQKRSRSTFDNYLRQLYCSEMSFITLVASFSDRVSLGR